MVSPELWAALTRADEEARETKRSWTHFHDDEFLREWEAARKEVDRLRGEIEKAARVDARPFDQVKHRADIHD